jgi:hypothetical protein
MQIPVFPDNVSITGDGTEEHPLAMTPVNSALSPFRTNRTNHEITAPEIAAGVANIPVLFSVPFADLNYTCAQAIFQNGALEAFNDFSAGDNHLKASTGFTAQIYVNGAAVAGTIVTLHTIAIRD